MNKALAYKQVDRQNELHTLAFLTNAAGGMKMSGNRQIPVYRTYKEFYDYQKELDKLESDKSMNTKKYKKLTELAHKFYKKRREVKKDE